MTGGRYVSSRNFETLKDATDFAINQPIESVIEIKHYDIEVSDIQKRIRPYYAKLIVQMKT